MIAARLAPLLAAERLRARGDAAGAMAAYAEILDYDPRCAPALIALGCLHIQAPHPATDPVRAQSLLLRACDVAPDDWQAWDALGIALAMTGDAAAAVTALGRAMDLAPDPMPLAARLIDAVVASGGVEAELARQDAIAALSPLDPLPLLLAGMLYGVSGALTEALDRLEAAAMLAPDNALLARMVAEVLVQAGQPRAAVTAYCRAVALAPDDLSLRNNLGAMLCRAHRHAEAETVLRAVLDEGGPRADALSNLANALCCQGRQLESVAIARAAVAANPTLPLPRRTLTTTLCYAPGIPAADLLAAAGAASALLPRSTAAAPRRAPRRTPGTPLRVGLLPATLRTHPVGWLTIAAFEALDPARIHLVVMAPDEVDDPMRQRFRAAAGTWAPVRPATDAAFVASAREQRLDVLIDLGGGGEGGHLGACAERLAPVQLKWVGSQGHSTGLAEMDGFVSDRWETPAGFDGDYSERLLRMPDGYCCYSPPAYAPAVAAVPAVARGGVTFGCLNNLAKITPEAITLWAAILHRLPMARLLVQAQALDEPETADAFRARFAAHGIDRQLDLRGGLAHRTMLATYGEIDVALDPFPYSGGLTTCEALWMGVPTLTMPGTSFASRHALSHMSNVGLGDWAVAHPAAYLEAAVARAADLAGLATLRAGLRETVRTSPLCDGPAFAKSFTTLLEDAVSRG